jgi:enoyl-CoA hydratase
MTASRAAVAGHEADLIARREGAVGVIRLNRPKTINAVTLQMFRDIDKALAASAPAATSGRCMKARR